jgi:hypothetical protein
MVNTATTDASDINAVTPVHDKPATGLSSQAADSLTSRDANAPKTGSTEADVKAANIVYGAVEFTGSGTAGTQTDSANIPLADNPAMNGAHEVVKGPDGKDNLIPLGKLAPGDHTIALKDQREFVIHVPPNDGKEKLPVMFMFSGSGEGQWHIEDFVQESGMNAKADDPKNKFIAVYPLPKRHLLGTGSDKTAYGWNVLDKNGGVLIDKVDSAKAGYDDTDYVKDIANLLPQVANVDATHKDWAATGFSQGGVFLNYLGANVPDLFPTMALVGTAVDTKYHYDVKPGNAEDVDIVNLRGDKITLPFLDNSSPKFKEEEVLRDILPKFLFEKLDDLAPINNSEASPQAQLDMYESRFGPATTRTSELSTPIASVGAKDNVINFTSTNPNNHNQLTEVNLIEAQHSFPEADPSGKRTNATTKYTEFDTDQQIVDQWMKFNQEQKK